MSIQGPSEPFESLPEITIPDYAIMLESSSQRILREEFERLGVINRAAIDHFNPNVEGASADIELTTGYAEIEAIEPQITDSKQRSMLHGLGLSFHHLDEGHPNRVFEYTYRDGEVHQIRMMPRGDGEQIPVFTSLGSREEGNPIESIRLLSHTLAGDLATRLDSQLDEHKLDRRLQREFNLDDTMLGLLDLSFEDKRSMLADFDKIQELDIIKLDITVLDHVRKKLVKTMLPGAKPVLSLDGGKKFANAQAAYEETIHGLINQYGLDTKLTRELIQSERLCRLKALNEQLLIRRRSTRIGFVALHSMVTLVGTGSGAAVGSWFYPLIDKDNPIKAAVIGGIVGGGSALYIAVEQALQRRKRTRRIKEFGFDHVGVDGSVHNQLNLERRIAERYMRFLEVQG